MSNEKLERNLEIVAKNVDGATPTELGEEYGLSRQRIEQIIKKYGANRSGAGIDTFRILFDFTSKEDMLLFANTLATTGFIDADWWLRSAHKSEVKPKSAIRNYLIDSGPIEVDERYTEVINPKSIVTPVDEIEDDE